MKPRRSFVSAVLSCLMLAASSTVAQAGAPADPKAGDGESVALVPAFHVGDRIDMEFELSRERREPNKAPTRGGGVTLVTIRVIEVTADSAVLAFDFGQPRLTDPNAAAELAQMVQGLGWPMSFEVMFDDEWSFAGLRNWQDVQRNMQKAMDVILDRAAKAGLPAEQMRQARATVAGMFANRRGVESASQRDIDTYYLPWGWQLPASGETAISDTLVTLPIGGAQIAGRMKLWLADYKRGQQATVAVEQTLDPNAAQAAIESMLKQMAGPNNAGPPPGSIPPVNITSIGKYVVDLKTGWVTEASFERKMTMGPASQTEVRRWRRVTASTSQPASQPRDPAPPGTPAPARTPPTRR